MLSAGKVIKIPDRIYKRESNADYLDQILRDDMNRGMMLFLQALGFHAAFDFGGACFAMTEMAQHAVYAENGIETFNKRLLTIMQIIQTAIEETYGQKPFKINYALLKQKTEGPESIPLTQLHENILKGLETLRRDEPALYWDCLATCDALALYQAPDSLDDKGTPYYNDVLPFIPRGQRTGGLQVTSSIVMPEKLKPNLKDIAYISTERLDKKQLAQYLADFKEIYRSPKITYPVSFNFGAEKHAIKITLNPDGTWLFFNINDRPPEIKRCEETKMIVDQVCEAYPKLKSNKPLKNASFNMVSHNNDAVYVYSELVKMHQKPLWKNKVRFNELENAALFGKKELVEQILGDKQKLKKMELQTILNALVNACDNGHVEIAKKLIETGKIGSDGLREVWQIACLGGNTDIVVMLIETCQCSKYARYNPFTKKLSKDDIKLGLKLACQRGHTKTVDALVGVLINEFGVPSLKFLASEFSAACKNNKLTAIEILVKKDYVSQELIESEFKQALAALHKKAYQKNSSEVSQLPEYHVVRMLLNSGRLDSQVCVREFESDCKNGHANKIQNWINFNFKINSPRGIHIPSQAHLAAGIRLAGIKHPKTAQLLRKAARTKLQEFCASVERYLGESYKQTSKDTIEICSYSEVIAKELARQLQENGINFNFKKEMRVMKTNPPMKHLVYIVTFDDPCQANEKLNETIIGNVMHGLGAVREQEKKSLQENKEQKELQKMKELELCEIVANNLLDAFVEVPNASALSVFGDPKLEFKFHINPGTKSNPGLQLRLYIPKDPYDVSLAYREVLKELASEGVQISYASKKNFGLAIISAEEALKITEKIKNAIINRSTPEATHAPETSTNLRRYGGQS